VCGEKPWSKDRRGVQSTLTDMTRTLQFVRDEISTLSGERIDADTGLFRSGLLDSLSLVSLVDFLESAFAIHVTAGEIVVENLDTMRHIAAYVERKRAAKGVR
jgi:acyl carrier protein